MIGCAAVQRSSACLSSSGAHPIRYLLVGATCAAANCGIIIGADRLAVHYVPATVASFFLVTPIAYCLHSRFTFEAPLTWHNLGLFAVGVAVGFPLALLAMVILCSGLRLPAMVAAPIATVLLLAWNYLSARFSIRSRAFRRLPS